VYFQTQVYPLITTSNKPRKQLTTRHLTRWGLISITYCRDGPRRNKLYTKPAKLHCW